jgi:hypothetical protein
MPAKQAPATISINRAPVLTLWAAVVAERLGFDRDEALTLGRAVAGLNAQSKGQRLGIYEPKGAEAARRRRPAEAGAVVPVELCGRIVPAIRTREGLRALERGKPSDPSAVERYLKSKFEDSLPASRAAMRALAKAYPPRELAQHALELYEAFRPKIPSGVRGWGAAGVLDLERIRALAKRG